MFMFTFPERPFVKVKMSVAVCIFRAPQRPGPEVSRSLLCFNYRVSLSFDIGDVMPAFVILMYQLSQSTLRYTIELRKIYFITDSYYHGCTGY